MVINFIKSLFGKGKIRVEFEGVNRAGKLVTGTAKLPYVGVYSEQEALEEFRNQLYYQEGVVATKCVVVAHIQG